MRTLTRLDTVKSRMERTCQALKEADNWTTLSADVEEVRDATVVLLSTVIFQKSYELIVTHVRNRTHAREYEKFRGTEIFEIMHPRCIQLRLLSFIAVSSFRAFHLNCL